MGVTSGAGTVYPFGASSGFMLLDQFLVFCEVIFQPLFYFHLFSLDHYIAWPSSIYGFWWPLWYLQTCLMVWIRFHYKDLEFRIWILNFGVVCHFQQYFSYIMATSFSGGRSQSTRREPPTMGKQLVNFISCGCESSAPLFLIYKAGRKPTPYWW